MAQCCQENILKVLKVKLKMHTSKPNQNTLKYANK